MVVRKNTGSRELCGSDLFHTGCPDNDLAAAAGTDPHLTTCTGKTVPAGLFQFGCVPDTPANRTFNLFILWHEFSNKVKKKIQGSDQKYTSRLMCSAGIPRLLRMS